MSLEDDLRWLTERFENHVLTQNNEISRLESRCNDLERRITDEVYDRERDTQRLEDKVGTVERDLAYR